MSSGIPFLSFKGQSKELRKKIERSLKDVYNGDNFILGKHLQQFEGDYAKFSQVRYCAGVGNGFDALMISLKALDIGPGDEVIVPAHTFIATWMAVTAVGARPVPVEPDINTYNIDASKIREVITPKTKAIIPVHLYGQACNMTSIMSLPGVSGQPRSKNNIAIIEDSAQSHGAIHRNKITGSFGTINATSFYPIKPLGALGDGGAITTSHRSLYEKVIRLRNYGSGKKYENELIGFNSRLDEIQAAVLSIKLKELAKTNRQRQDIAKRYIDRLVGVGDIILPKTISKSSHVYHLFVIRTNERTKLMQHLQRKGIQTLIHYPVPPHLQQAYQHLGYKKGSLPITEVISGTAMSLPCWPGMSKRMIDQVVSGLKTYFHT